MDAMLDEKCFLDDIAARVNLLLAERAPGLSIHRSSIHRHAKKCYSLRERAARLKERESVSRNERRIFVQWPEHLLFGELAGNITNDADAIAAGELREADAVWISVSFETQPARNPQNQGSQRTLKPPEGEETMPEEKKDGLHVRLRKLFGQDKPAEPPAAPEPPPEETLEQVQARCEHVMSPAVAGGRCIHCGFQPPRWQPQGISRADYVAARRRF